MDANGLATNGSARSDGRGNAQSVKRTTRRNDNPFMDPVKVKSGMISDGARILIDAPLAQDILTQHAFAGQRVLDISNLRAHSLDMQRGRFWPGSQVVFARLPGGKMILVDGYHRLHAVQASETIAEFQVRVEPVADMDAVRDLYCSIDTNLRKRSDAEISRAAGLSDETGVKQRIITAALGAVTAITCGMRILKSVDRPAEVVTAYGRKDAVREWVAELMIYSNILAKASQTIKSRMLSQGMMAMALVTLRYQPKTAVKFWTGVAEDDGLRKGDPRKALIKALTEGSHRGRVEAGLLYASVAWNAWVQNRRLQILRINSKTKCQPLGTPFASPDTRNDEQDDAA
jgi:hypothetical protein